MKFKLLLGQFTWGNKPKHVNNFFCFQKFADNAKQCFALTPQANFPNNNLNFTEGEGDGIKSRILFKIFSTLSKSVWSYCVFRSSYLSYSYLDSVTTLCAMCSLFEDSRSINSKFSSAVIMFFATFPSQTLWIKMNPQRNIF